jgi:hypothetical protein
LSIPVAITYTSSGTKALLKQRRSLYSSSQQMLRGGLTLQPREIADSDNKSIQRTVFIGQKV